MLIALIRILKIIRIRRLTMNRFGIKDFDLLRENNLIVAKSAVKGCPNLWDTYSSFANTFGGTIILGVKEEDDGSFSVSHMENPEKVLKEFYNSLNNKEKVSTNILTDKDIVVRKEGEDTIIVISVPRADRHFKPIYINGNVMTGTYKRGNEGAYHCPEYEVKAMIADSLDNASATPFADLSCLDENSLKSYRNAFSSHSPAHPFNKLDNQEFLLRLGGCIKDDKNEVKLTKSGLLMFGKGYEIENLLPQYFLDYSHFPKDDSTIRYDDRIESSSGNWSGNLFDFLFLALERIGKEMKASFSWEGNSEVRDDDSPLKRAMREAIVNTLSNSDFSFSQGLVIKHYPSKIIFENPGLLMISREKALEGGHSDPRNPTILKMLNLIGMGERSGSGIPLIEDVLIQAGLPSLSLDQKVEPDRTILTIPLVKEEKRNTISSNQEIRIKLSKLGFNEEDSEKIVDFFVKTNTDSFTRKDLADALSISEQKASLIMRSLTKEKIISLAPFYQRGCYVFVK